MTVTVWFVRDGPQMQRSGSAYQLPLELYVSQGWGSKRMNGSLASTELPV